MPEIHQNIPWETNIIQHPMDFPYPMVPMDDQNSTAATQPWRISTQIWAFRSQLFHLPWEHRENVLHLIREKCTMCPCEKATTFQDILVKLGPSRLPFGGFQPMGTHKSSIFSIGYSMTNHPFWICLQKIPVYPKSPTIYIHL